MKKFASYLILSYLTALIFETIANTVGDGKLFESPNAVAFFLIWYGLFYTLAYLLLRNRSLIVVAVAFAVVGTLAEIFIFHRLNIIVDPIIYAIMGLVPFAICRRLVGRV